jgi:hypothetical protein
MYAVVQYLLCVLLFPEEMADYNGFKEYAYSRRQWIFSLMTVLFVADLADTFIKGGGAYVHSLGAFYYAWAIVYILLSAAAITMKGEWFHAGFAIFATACEIAVILKYYMTVD